MDPIQSKLAGRVVLAAVVVLIPALAIGYFSLLDRGPTTPPVDVPLSQSPASVSPAITADNQAVYKDGVYDVIGSYTSPGGAEEIGVKVTLKDSIIADAAVVAKATKGAGKRWQGIFVDNFKTYVVGKNIDEVKLTNVSGSSLTPKGFNDALEKVKKEARS